MAPKLKSRTWLPYALIAAALSGIAVGKAIDQLTAPELEDALGQCGIVQELNYQRKRQVPPTSGFAQQVFNTLFPYGPAINALLATLYISGPPNFLLALCPPNINPSSLTVMVAFAVGGLLGDTIFHLLPEIFLGETSPDRARFVLVDTNKNLLLGLAIIVGFLTFTAMDKTLRIATAGAGHDHGKKDEKERVKPESAPKGQATGSEKAVTNGSLRSRKAPSEVPQDLEIYTDTQPLRLANDRLKSLWSTAEPARSNRWLSEVLQEDDNGGVTQIAIWKAYEAAFKANREVQMLEATVLIHNASKTFENASAQIIEGAEKKFIIKGVRPASITGSQNALVKASKAVKAVPRPSVPAEEPSHSIRLSAYLNLIADFTHNITDGLALSSSFYASSTLGATTTVAVFFHEIPHEVGDFALLVQSGFSKRKAMAAQFVTALGALLGTCLGIAVQELGKSDYFGDPKQSSGPSKGLLGTGLGWGDLLLPFTAGTFLYVGTVAVIPELLETGSNKREEVKKTVSQFLAMLVGALDRITWE